MTSSAAWLWYRCGHRVLVPNKSKAPIKSGTSPTKNSDGTWRGVAPDLFCPNCHDHLDRTTGRPPSFRYSCGHNVTHDDMLTLWWALQDRNLVPQHGYIMSDFPCPRCESEDTRVITPKLRAWLATPLHARSVGIVELSRILCFMRAKPTFWADHVALWSRLCAQTLPLSVFASYLDVLEDVLGQDVALQLGVGVYKRYAYGLRKRIDPEMGQVILARLELVRDAWAGVDRALREYGLELQEKRVLSTHKVEALSIVFPGDRELIKARSTAFQNAVCQGDADRVQESEAAIIKGCVRLERLVDEILKWVRVEVTLPTLLRVRGKARWEAMKLRGSSLEAVDLMVTRYETARRDSHPLDDSFMLISSFSEEDEDEEGEWSKPEEYDNS